ncbi:hypothetical protein SDC9_195209 [bioreactor metagenome]|uniref:Uncharacterized protein n=1 Tax=bioreactor metagenome TaxID=1076179 RepID=A0A645I9M7_9ZZZZ
MVAVPLLPAVLELPGTRNEGFLEDFSQCRQQHISMCHRLLEIHESLAIGQ